MAWYACRGKRWSQTPTCTVTVTAGQPGLSLEGSNGDQVNHNQILEDWEYQPEILALYSEQYCILHPKLLTTPGTYHESMATDSTAGTDPVSPDTPVQIDGQNELDSVVNEHGVVLVDFYADWCGPCRMLDPVVTQLAAETDAVVAKVDVDTNQRLASSYGVRGVPALILFVDGTPVQEMVGVQPKEQLRALIESHTDR